MEQRGIETEPGSEKDANRAGSDGSVGKARAPDPDAKPANLRSPKAPDESPDESVDRLRALALARAALALVDADPALVRGLLVDLVDLLEPRQAATVISFRGKRRS